MDSDRMSNEDNYCFDVGGYLVVRGALRREQLQAATEAIGRVGRHDGMLSWPGANREIFRDLLVHPTLVWYLNQLCGTGFRLEQLPRLVTDDPACGVTFDGTLSGGDEPRDPRRAYYHQNERRQCQLVRAIWALDDAPERAGGLVFVQASHKSNVVAPDDLLNGRDDMGLVRQTELCAGDLLLLADSTIRGFRPWQGKGNLRLVDYGFAARGVVLESGTGFMTQQDDDGSDWMMELSPTQRSVLHTPGRQNTTPPEVIYSDGRSAALGTDRDNVHPAFLQHDEDSGIDHKEFFYWDLCGHLVVRDVMTADDLVLANEAIDRFEDRIVVGEELARGSAALAGSGRPTLGRLMELPDPYNDPFRRMVAHPLTTHRLTWMGGSGFRCGQPTAFCAVKGTSGHALHDSNEPLNPCRSYVYRNGRSYCEAVTVTWQLRDVADEDGGFACVPGSHKAQYRMPPGVRSCDATMGLVHHPTFRAGDVLFFMDGAQTHGALAWQGEIARRGILIKYSSRNFNRAGGELVQPQNRWGDVVEGMTDAQLAVMRGADRDNHNGNVPRLSVTDGDVLVEYDRTGGLYSAATPDGPVVPGT